MGNCKAGEVCHWLSYPRTTQFSRSGVSESPAVAWGLAPIHWNEHVLGLKVPGQSLSPPSTKS